MKIVNQQQRRAVANARAVNLLARRVRVNEVPISAKGVVAVMGGPSGINAPITSITYIISNTSGAAATYAIGDPNGLVAAAHGATWAQPSGAKNSSVAAVQASFGTHPVLVKGLNYIVSNALQYDEPLTYRYGDQNGRYAGDPIDITPQLRNDQYISTRQTFSFEKPYVLDETHCFTLRVPDTYQVTLSLILDASVAG